MGLSFRMVTRLGATLRASVPRGNDREVTPISKDKDSEKRWYIMIYTGNSDCAYLSTVEADTQCYTLELKRGDTVLARFERQGGIAALTQFNRTLYDQPLCPGDNLSLLIDGYLHEVKVLKGLPED